MNKKQIISWCLFDFANSSYSAVIGTVIFPVYYAGVIVGNTTGAGDQWWGRAISLSMFLIAVTSPFLGGIADYAGLRKRLLGLYTAACVAAVACFAFLRPGDVLPGFLLVVLATIGMEGGIVFYNSFLPVIAPPDHHGRVSAWGFGVGYAGSILSLIIALPLARTNSIEAIWPVTAVFFAAFSLPAFIFLPADRPARGLVAAGITGIERAWLTLREIWGGKESRKFLIAYLIYEDGVVTVIAFSSLYAAATLGFSTAELIMLFLIIQFTALLGVFSFAKPIDTRGPKAVVVLSLLLWIGVVAAAYSVGAKSLFWIVASTAGLGLGTVQAASRAFFTQFIPRGKEAEYFGVYSLVGKSSAIFGPLIFGEVAASFGSQRPAILSIALFFLIGLAILFFVRGGGPNVKR